MSAKVSNLRQYLMKSQTALSSRLSSKQHDNSEHRQCRADARTIHGADHPFLQQELGASEQRREVNEIASDLVFLIRGELDNHSTSSTIISWLEGLLS